MAERFAGHPHIVELLDAFVAPKLLDAFAAPEVYLVYRHAGVSLWAHTDKFQKKPSVKYAQLCMRHVALGLARMHEANMIHGDLHPSNILVSKPAGRLPHFVVADLGSAFEAGPNWHLGVMEFNAPERLADAAVLGPRADMFSLGVVLAVMLGFKFPYARTKEPRVQIKALCRQLGCPDHTELPAIIRGLFRGIVPSQAKGFGREVRCVYGVPAEDLLERLLRWSPDARPSALDVSHHLFPRCGSLRGLGPSGQVGLFGGKRHKWAVQTACLDVDVLTWLRAEITKKLASGTADKFGKFCVTGRTDTHCEGSALNARSIKDVLPLPRLCAWVCAFRDLNKLAFAAFYARASRRLRAAGNTGENGDHFLKHGWHRWLFQAAEVHLLPSPGDLKEDQHQDGAASVLHMGLTLFGRRDVVCQQGEDLAPVILPQFPGALYIGGLTGPEHQVCHHLPLGQDDVFEDFSVAVMFRCCLFPHHRARCMGVTPSPPRSVGHSCTGGAGYVGGCSLGSSHFGSVPGLLGGFGPGRRVRRSFCASACVRDLGTFVF